MRVKPSPTWIILSVVSLAPYLALPLSGFTIQLTNGYAQGVSSNSNPSLVGQTPASFQDQSQDDDIYTSSFNHWKSNAQSVLSSKSAYYVPIDNTSALDRRWLQTFPNEWPDDEQMRTFIAPQARDIIEGDLWGLEASLNCTIVSSISQFELLSQRNQDGSAPRCAPINFNSSVSEGGDYGLPDLCDFDVYLLSPIDNETYIGLDTSLVLFPVGKMEFAAQYNKDSENFDLPPFSDTEPVIFEAALWQHPITLAQSCPPLEKIVSNDLGTTISGFQKEFTLSNVSAELLQQEDTSSQNLEAIGFQCKSMFRTGTATVDGRSGTYSSFTVQEADPVVSGGSIPIETAVPRIFRSEVSAALTLLEMNSELALNDLLDNLGVNWTDLGAGSLNPMAYLASNSSWLQNIYRAADAYYQQPLYCDDDGNVNVTLTSSWQQLQLLNSTQFMTSFIRAHKAYALEITRPRGKGEQMAEWERNATVIFQTLIISPGDVPPQLVVALLSFWAASCFVLGIVFGARPRWSETLDGFSMFRFGSDNPRFNATNGRRGGEGGGTARRYTDCPGLKELPGLVGDARPDRNIGYITLVENWRGVASRGKKYL